MKPLAILCVCLLSALPSWPQTPNTNDAAQYDRKADAVNNVLRMESRILKMSDTSVRTQSLALLYSSVCEYDRSLGAKLFGNGLTEIEGSEYTEVNEASRALFQSRALFLARALACDPTMKREVTRHSNGRNGDRAGAGAIEAAGQSIAAGDGVSTSRLLGEAAQSYAELTPSQMVAFARSLTELQLQSPQQADSVLKSALASLSTYDPRSVAAALYPLGTVLFTARGLPMKDSIAVMPLPNGGQAIVLDEIRTSASPDAVRAYLETAALLLRGGGTKDLVGQSLASQLSQHAELQAPSLVPGLQETASRAVGTADQSQVELLVHNLRPGVIGSAFESLENDIEKDSISPRERDRLVLLRIQRFCGKREWKSARELVRRLSESDDRSAATQFVVLSEFVSYIAAADMERAKQLIPVLQPGLAQAWAALGVAAGFSATKEQGEVEGWLNVALGEIPKADSPDQGQLFAAAAALILPYNEQLAHTLLGRSIASFNDADYKDAKGRSTRPSETLGRIRLTPSGLMVTLKGGGRVGSELLRAGPHLHCDLNAAIATMSSAEPARLYAILNGLLADWRWAPAASVAMRTDLRVAYEKTTKTPNATRRVFK